MKTRLKRLDINLWLKTRLERLDLYFCCCCCLLQVWDPTFGSADSITTSGYNQ